MKRRTYKFASRRQSKEGLWSSAAGSLSLLLTMVLIYISYTNKGETGKATAVLGLFAVLLCIAGALFGRRSLREEDSKHFFGWLGLIISILLLVFWIGVLGIGFMSR